MLNNVTSARNKCVKLTNEKIKMTDYKKIKTAVVGVGSMGQNHARILSEISNLVYVFDINESQAKKVSADFNVKYYTALDSIKEKVDAVVIAVPTEYHENYSSYFANKGNHILVEKPIARTKSEAETIIRNCEKAGVVLTVGHIERFNPVIVKAMEFLNSGIWGEIITISSKRVSNYPSRIRDVGVIVDLGIHDIDLIQYMSGSECQTIKAVSGNFENKKYFIHLEKQFRKEYYKDNFNLDINYSTICAWKK